MRYRTPRIGRCVARGAAERAAQRAIRPHPVPHGHFVRTEWASFAVENRNSGERRRPVAAVAVTPRGERRGDQRAGAGGAPIEQPGAAGAAAAPGGRPPRSSSASARGRRRRPTRRRRTSRAAAVASGVRAGTSRVGTSARSWTERPGRAPGVPRRRASGASGRTSSTSRGATHGPIGPGVDQLERHRAVGAVRGGDDHGGLAFLVHLHREHDPAAELEPRRGADGERVDQPGVHQRLGPPPEVFGGEHVRGHRLVVGAHRLEVDVSGCRDRGGPGTTSPVVRVGVERGGVLHETDPVAAARRPRRRGPGRASGPATCDSAVAGRSRRSTLGRRGRWPGWGTRRPRASSPCVGGELAAFIDQHQVRGRRHGSPRRSGPPAGTWRHRCAG